MPLRNHVLVIPLSLLLLIACYDNAEGPSRTMRMDHTLNATIWFQTSAEMRAIFYQSFALARIRLDEHLAQAQFSKPPAVVVDIDETLLDNSPHSVKLIQTDESYPSFWAEWVERGKAEALPGAVDFLRYADSKGVSVFYVSNRDARFRDVTIRNLRTAGFPQADTTHMFLKVSESGKEERRQTVQKTHTILLLIGDNLNDFASVFEKKSIRERKRLADEMRSEFGDRFIVLPNPLYGEWEGAVYDYEWSMTDAQKRQRRLDALKAF